jgi:hypothetical protein
MPDQIEANVLINFCLPFHLGMWFLYFGDDPFNSPFSSACFFFSSEAQVIPQIKA